jgi:hypothetical protein
MRVIVLEDLSVLPVLFPLMTGVSSELLGLVRSKSSSESFLLDNFILLFVLYVFVCPVHFFF